MKREDLVNVSELQRDDLLVDMFDEYGWVGTRTATDADLAALDYYKLDVDVEALRGVVKDRDEGWPMGNGEIETLISAARQVLAALDGETS